MAACWPLGNRRDSGPGALLEGWLTRCEADLSELSISVAFLADGKHIVSRDQEGKTRRWRVEDGVKVRTPMDMAGSPGGSVTRWQ